MNADPNSLTSGPLYYFLIHSGTFVLLTASIFFILGLAFGWLTWSRHRRAVRRLTGELEGKKDEIALLKRTLAELNSRLASEADEEETSPLSNRYADTPDLVLGSFLATASTVLPEAQAIKTASTPKSEAVKPTPLMIPEVIMPASTPSAVKAHPPVASNVLKSLIVGTPPLPAPEPEPEPTKEVAPPVATPAATPAATPTENTVEEKDTPPKEEPAPAEITSSPAPVEEKTQPADTAPPSDVIRLVSDPHLGLVFRARPQIVDDLSQLKGVASGIESRLNELGVYTFKQIALWSDENIVEFSRLLSFKDRIHREQWVDQARELHFHTYSERL